jgi:hypothetical protein
MKELDKKQAPEVSGGYTGDDGCTDPPGNPGDGTGLPPGGPVDEPGPTDPPRRPIWGGK